MFPNLVANDYKSHVVVNGMVTFWLISTSANSYTILLFSSNSNGNPSTDFSRLGGTYSFTNLNSSNASCVATLSIYSSVACRPSYVCYYCCCYKCCYKCWKCFGLVIVSIQFSHTSPSKCRWRTPKLLDGFNCDSKSEDNRRKWSWGELPSLKHFRGRGVCWNSRMELGKMTSNSLIHINLHKINNKLVSA